MVDNNLIKPLAYPVPDRAHQLESDATYKIAAGVELKLDVYSPESAFPKMRHPAVIFVHGGPIKADNPLKPKEWGVFKSYGKLVASRGLIGITLNHRLYALGDLSRSVGDVNAAIRFLIDNRERYRIDTGRICLWGFSGGGPLLGPIIQSNVENVCCWLAFYAHLDLGNIAHQVADQLTAAEIRRFTTSAILEEKETGEIPFFIARAGKDRATLNESIDNFVRKAVEKNRPVTFANHPNGRHGFDVLDANAETRAVITQALSFLDAQVHRNK